MQRTRSRSPVNRFATTQEIIAAELAKVAVPPSGLETFYKDRTGAISVRAPEADVGDGTQAILDAVAEAKAVGGPVRLQFAQRKVRLFAGVVNLDFGDVMLASDNGTELIANEPTVEQPLTEDSLITVAGAGKSVGYTTLTAGVTDPRNTYQISVADSSMFASGDVILISATAAADYFYGVSGQSGFAPVKNGEMVTVRQVETGVLKLAEALSYTYSGAGTDTQVYKMDMLKNVRVSGLRGTGLGYGPGGIWDGLGPGFLTIENVNGFSKVDCNFRRFGSWGLRTVNVIDAYVKHSKCIGLDYSDVNLDAGQSNNNYGGWSFSGCKRVYVDDTHAENVRHPIDVSSSNGGPISNIISYVNSGSDGYLTASVAGSHVCDNMTIINYITRRGGIYMRGKNWAIIGCDIATSEASSNGIASGSGESARPYSETPDMGLCRVIGNRIRSAIGMELRNACSGLVFAQNQLDCSSHGIYAFGKTFRDWQVTGNLFNLSRRAAVRHGVYIDSVTDIELQVLENIRISDNLFKNVSAMARICGTNNIAAPAEGIVLQDNTMLGTAFTPSNAVLFPTGFYGEKIICDDVKVTGNVPTTALVLNAEPGYYRRRPQFSGYQPLAPRNIGYSPAVPTSDGQTVSLFDTYQLTPAGALMTCTVPGTTGTLAGVTGSITSGTAALTLSGTANFDVMPGMYLSIAGAGVAAAALVARVVSCTFSPDFTATACVLDTNASTTVAGNAVTYRNPTWV